MDSGVYTELENAVKGQVVVRFPPEASGFLHIGHAKAALLNYHYKILYDGKFIMRFDDTNPEKEKEDFEQAIMQDVRSLGIQWDHFSYTSDHFDLLLEKCVEMLKNGHAYVDDTPTEEMRTQREKRQESKCRSQSVDENLKKWDQMVCGTEEGQKCCVRAKIDYQSKNGCLRDPVIYRCKNEPHPRHGTKYKVYPTYDFACPIVDSIEGVTHSLRTSEYIDRDPQFYWFCDTLNLRKPIIAAYSRLNMMNTVLSKRKLTFLVEEKIVDGWDDPRMPTVQGILRRGLTVEGLKRFIIAQGSSKHIVFMEWDKIWAFNKKYLDPIVPRYTAVEQTNAVTVLIDNYDGTLGIDLAVHPKDPSQGVRKLTVAKELLIEQVDGALMKEGDTVTLLSIGNVKVVKVDKNEAGPVSKVTVALDLDNKDFKKTLKVSWVNKNTAEVAKLIYYDHIITKSVLDKDEDFKQYVNRDSKVEVRAYMEPDCKTLNARTIIQFNRKGNFICDSAYDQAQKSMAFIYIPDGTSKNPYTSVVVSSGKTPKEASAKPKKEKPQAPPSDPAKEAANLKKQQEKAEAKAKKKEAHKAGGKKPGPASGGDQKAKNANETTRQTKLAIGVKKEENFSEWYTEVIIKSEMIEYYDVSGCYIFRPWSYAIWENIQKFFDAKIKSIGVENCYFPIFVSQNALEREKDHIADFAPEVAWVTKSGQSDLTEPIAIRPTSETVMYPAFSKWVQSYRDLPIRLNQWNNVVRWEFKDPTPFIRTREFLWQEGHTAFATRQEAVEEVEQILEFYASVYEDLLAIPVVRGRKTAKEKFPGADFTLTIEGYVSANGRGIQAATSHHLGQNFSKMFDIGFQSTEDPTKREHAHQNSWGLSTRTIGVLVMTHGDDKGLVLPPRVSPLQVVVVPVGITVSISAELKSKLYECCDKIHSELIEAGIRSKLDKSDFLTPGRKFNYYEQKGVCLRVELGPKDLEKSQALVCRRDTGDKISMNLVGLAGSIADQLEAMQKALYAKAKHEMDTHQVLVTDWNEFLKKLNEKCTLIAPFCGRPDCEDDIKKNSARESTDAAVGPLMGAKSLCIPKRQPNAKLDDKSNCIYPGCKEKPQYWTLFGRSY